MEKIRVEISSPPEFTFQMKDFPELTSGNKLVNKGIGILKSAMPAALRYLAKQRIMGHLSDYRIEICGVGDLTETEVRRRLGDWMRRKRTRRLAYVVLELLLMPFTAFVALLPGPNVVFYGLFVLFYFHAKALLSLSRIKAENLTISLVRD